MSKEEEIKKVSEPKKEEHKENEQQERIKEEEVHRNLNSILFVHGLDRRVDEGMIYKLFNDYNVMYIKIAKDSKTSTSLGYAFVGFKNRQKAEQALREVNYSRVMNKTVRLAWYDREIGNSREKPENNIFVKNIPREVTAKQFHDHFSQYGLIVSAKIAEDEEGDSLGYGYVLYDKSESAKKAIEECHGKPWKDSKMKLYVCQLERKRPRKPLRFNNLYVRNIPKDWDEEKLKNYFSTYGEISSLIIRSPVAEKLHKNTPRCIYNNILEHKYGFVCFKSIDGPAEAAVVKVPYMKLTDEEYNKRTEEYAQKFRELHIKEEDVYKCACYIYEEKLEDKMKTRRGRNEIKKSFEALMKENDGFYVVRNLEDRLYCCQALKKKEREKRLRILCEKLKNKVRARYKFCNLYVKNLPDNFEKEALMQIFGKYGGIRSARIVHGNPNDPNFQFIKRKCHVFAFICYLTPENAKAAKDNLNGKIFRKDGPRLYVDYHQTKKERLEFLKLQMMKRIQKNPYKYYVEPLLKPYKKVRPQPLLGPIMMPRPPCPIVPPEPSYQNLPNFQNIKNIQSTNAPSFNSNIPMFPPMPFPNANFPMFNPAMPVIPNANANVPNTTSNIQPRPNVNRTAEESMKLGKDIYAKLLEGQKYNNYQHLFPKIVSIFLRNDSDIINAIISDTKSFDNNMINVLIPQAQKETQEEAKVREHELFEQKRKEEEAKKEKKEDAEEEEKKEPEMDLNVDIWKVEDKKEESVHGHKEHKEGKEKEEEIDIKKDDKLQSIFDDLGLFREESEKDKDKDKK